MELQFAFVGGIWDNIKKFDWSRLIPRFRVDWYKYGAAGIEFTWPWNRTGLGLGVGLGTVDLWLGWPRADEDLCKPGCSHRPVDSPVE